MLFCWVWWYCVPRLRTVFVPCVQKGAAWCQPVLTPFGGSFGGQICKTDSHTHQSNKCAALVSLRNTNTLITGFLHRKRPHELMMKFYSLARSCTQAPLHTIPARRPCCREKRPCLGTFTPRRCGALPAKYRPKIPAFRGFFILPQRLLPKLDFPVQVNPAQINN